MPLRSSVSHYGVYIGLLEPHIRRVDDCLERGDALSADFVIVDILMGDEMNFDNYIDIRGVPARRLNSGVVGRVSYPKQSSCPFDHSHILDQMEWAAYAGMYAVILDITQMPINDVSTIISRFCLDNPPESCVTRVWLQCNGSEWSAWDKVRTMTGSPSKLSVFLDVSFSVDNSCLKQWLGESVSAFRIADGWDDEYIIELFRMNVQPVCKTKEEIERIRNCFNSGPNMSESEDFIAPYHDSLQLPLQPLADDMENGIYETFEADRTKYDLYEKAIYRRLEHLHRDRIILKSHTIHVAVVGAGRGGLVDSAIRAFELFQPNISNTYITKYALTLVEKNKKAVRSLRFRKKDDPLWNDNSMVSIEICEAYMGDWKPSQPVDILVSELLGSLGDNEGSPECLDSVMHHLHADHGVSIPCKYFSSLEPVTAHKAWMNVRDAKKFETPLVVAFHSVFRPSHPQALLEFHHTQAAPSSNERSKTLHWKVSQDARIHGFAGYFECCLYDDILMSIHPPTATEGMVSWFPAFLPLTCPIHVKAGESVAILVERKSTNKRMWIEWTLQSPVLQSTLNSQGISHSVGI